MQAIGQIVRTYDLMNKCICLCNQQKLTSLVIEWTRQRTISSYKIFHYTNYDMTFIYIEILQEE